MNKRAIIGDNFNCSAKVYDIKANSIIMQVSWVLFKLRDFNFFKNKEHKIPIKEPTMKDSRNILINDPIIIIVVVFVNSKNNEYLTFFGYSKIVYYID